MNGDNAALRPDQLVARTAEAFDAGLAFAWAHRKRLCQGGFIAGILEIFLTYSQYFVRLSSQQTFLVIIATVGATAWLISYAGIYCLSEFRGIRVSPALLLLRALHSMPKIFISYFLFLLCAFVLLSFPPLLLFAPFLIWAPAFCAAELFALPLKEADEPHEEMFEDEVVYRKVIRFRFFQGRPIWDPGLARSIAFAGQNLSLTLQFSLLGWAAAVIPAGLMILIAGYYPSFSSLMIESLITSFLQVLLFAASFVSFLLLLPQEARAEIGLPAADEIMKNIPRTEVPDMLKFRHKKYPFFVVAILVVISTQLTWQWMKHRHTMPESVKVSVEGSQLTKDRFIVTLQLIDDGQLFRWLDPARLRLELLDKDGKPVVIPSPGSAALGSGASASAPVSAVSGETTEKPADSKPKLIEPERVMPFGVDGTALEEANFTPYARPLRLVLYFAPPAVASGKFRLYHGSLFGLGEPVVEGEFGTPDAAATAAVTTNK